jgi:hypothetical protein
VLRRLAVLGMIGAEATNGYVFVVGSSPDAYISICVKLDDFKGAVCR